MTTKATVGRIIHYVTTDRHGQEWHRPAIVNNAFESSENRVNATVFPDPFNDTEQAPYGVASIAQDEDTKAVGTWHYPERE
ncbi:hypothetical protein [Deinococcus misasensis]|uniref:hypothetical protein n=1 Tax=Deinococcus misasensis TaxID=392413 RepID=UPI0005553910|nr:hypothetical protein [Deinococcus misasensis]